MSDMRNYGRKKDIKREGLIREYTAGYETYGIGALLRSAREDAGITQEELARRLGTKKSAISRIENHAEDIRLSTLEKFADALGKKLKVTVHS